MIYIKAGHSLSDGGAKVGNYQEATINRWIRNELKEILPEAHYLPDNLTLREALDYINEKAEEGDFALDIHLNSNNDKRRRGTEGYYSEDSRYAEVMSRCVSKKLLIPNKGARHDSQTYVGSLGFLRHLKCNSTLIEVCYLTNEEDRKMLLDNAGIKLAAQGIKDGLDVLFKKEELKITLLQQLVALYQQLINLLKKK